MGMGYKEWDHDFVQLEICGTDGYVDSIHNMKFHILF